MSSQSTEQCPVDHGARQKWMEVANATKQSSKAEECPVDHNARQKWLQTANPRSESQPTQQSPLPRVQRFSLDSLRWETRQPRPRPQPRSAALETQRQVSTIPRATAKHDELDADHWVYPSEQMFFNAMQRKGHEARAADMSSIIPIHNAVNERAWAEIRSWETIENPEASPKLVSFSGDSKALTPRARWNMLLGYNAPFDRHDWVIDRGGKQIDYVIDFYSGKGGGLNFYLDVRPKLNSWEGIKLRAMKTLGF